MCGAGFAHTVIVLPRIVPHVRNFDPERTPSEDERIWDVPKLAGLVEDFCSLTGATTLPSLAEWSVLPDKVDTAFTLHIPPPGLGMVLFWRYLVKFEASSRTHAQCCIE